MIGELIKHYRVQEIVGSGGMGVVYRALDVNLERTVAVKVLSAEFRDDREYFERFRQEARIQAGLNHPNIATLFDFFVWNGSPVAVMEFIEGETLRSMVARLGPIPSHVALPIFVQVLRGVAAGHKRGIIHRDLKPSNLMVTGEGLVKVTDFGIAKVRSATGLTQVSTRVGSPSYMAPEQILGLPVDEHTDIYVLGGTLYELLCGRPPFQGVSQFEIDSAHVRDPPKAPTEYYPDIPPAAVDAVMRALAKEPSERFATAEEFIEALPDLHGVPYVAAEAAAPISSGTAALSEMPTLQRSAREVAPGTGNLQAQVVVPKTVRTWRAVAAIGVSGLLVVLSVVGIVRYFARQAGVGRDHGSSQLVVAERPAPTRQADVIARPDAATGQPNTAVTAVTARPDAATGEPNTSVTAPLDTATVRADTAVTTPLTIGPRPAEPPSPSLALNSGSGDLSGVWTGTYLDRSGRAQLEVLKLQMRQVTNGAITGRFTYRAASAAGGECTLDKSNYSTQSKRLRLIVHCRDPNHPKYLNVPLEFTDVDPHASSIEGGRLAFHLADDIVVMLKRTDGV